MSENLFADNLERVNPRIGTGSRGNCLIGPALPFSLVRLGPDISYPQPNSGYRPQRAIVGFSHTHLSGSGGCSRYGNIRVMPFLGEPRQLKAAPFITFPATDRQWSIPVEEEARVGRYRCRFAFGVEAELTSTPRSGVHRYTFTGPGPRYLIVDFASVLQGTGAPAGQVPYCEDWEMEGSSVDGKLDVLNAHEIEGCSNLLGGWGHFDPYAIFFFLRSGEAFTNGKIFGERGAVEGVKGTGKGLRVLLTYPETCSEINLEIGISYSSLERARSAVSIGGGQNSLEIVSEKARKAWKPWLDRVRVKGGTPDQQALLATSLYHLFTMPTDLSIDGQTTAQGGPQFTDIICLWDSIRNANSLFNLIAPEFSADFMNFLLDHADKTGWLFDAHIAGHAAFQQSGCSAEILFSEAARKGVPGVDYRRALAACVRNAETPSPDPYFVGRYVKEYEELGYLSTRVAKGCVSRHIEYTYQDWCIARLAEHVGDKKTAARFDAKAQRLWNLWREDKKSFWPRHPDGSWVDYPGPHYMVPDGWNDPYSYESSLVHWSLSGLQDIDGLIERHGGEKAFADYLELHFKNHGDIEKETRMHIPHLFAFVGRSERAAAQVSWSLANRYANSSEGLPDDEDMGCHSAFYICNSIGLYPIYGRTLYSVVPPLFEEIAVDYGQTGKSLRIVRMGSGESIEKVRVNGIEQQGTLIEHKAIAEGGLIEVVTAS